MTRIPIPSGAWMRLRQRGRYAYAKNTPPIIWSNKEPAKGQPIYYVAWGNGQGPLMANRVVIER